MGKNNTNTNKIEDIKSIFESIKQTIFEKWEVNRWI